MKKFILIPLLSLASCASIDTPTERIEATCETASTLIEALTPRKASMTQAQVTTVTSAIDVLQPVCGQGETPPTADTVKYEALQLVIAKLQAVQSELGSK